MTIEESVSKMKHLKYKALQEDIIVHDTYSDDYGLLDESALTALDMAIASLEAWDKIKQEINDLFNKPACYMPNYDAYKMFLEIIDKHKAESEDKK